jgi:hypothetical protein
MEHCAGHLPMKQGIPQPTLKCAPSFFPHVASRDSQDYLSKIIGSHNYFKSGARNGTDDYANPVSKGLHPVFLVFPPLDDVLLVRVDDMDRTQMRDAISSVYLAIRNNMVTDQLNVGCDWDANYVCSTSEHQPKYQLMKNGKFKKLE